jgi:lambda repressor-like predicted transcriptional regulator
MVAPFAESALDQEAAALKEKQISELIALVEEKLESSNEGKSKPAEIAPSSFQPTRQEFVQQILDERGWSIEDWANEAGVAYHTARDYLTGKRSPFGYNRVKLAKALGISVNSLPK